MGRSRKFNIWILLPMFFVLGIVVALMRNYGLTTTWHFLGKPDEQVAKIIGISEGHKLLVSTTTGHVYSFEFYPWMSIPFHPSWIKENLSNLEVDPVQSWGADFVTLPPLFRVIQIFDMEYQLVEGIGEVKFALSEEGDLWIWNHTRGNFSNLLYIFFSIIGLALGAIIVLLFKGIKWIDGAIFHKELR